MSLLFSPVDIGNLRLVNRIVVPPMCQYAAENGEARDWHVMHYGQLAFSGAGLLIIEATAVEAAGRISALDLGLWSDATEAAFARLLRGIRTYSAMPVGVQLAHAGRKASQQAPWLGGRGIPSSQGGWRTLAPSPLPFEEDGEAPIALDEQGIAAVVEAFGSAAARAGRLGFDCVEMHAAHGYLLHEFLSPLSNVRTDAYGGSLENRMRLPLRIFETIRAAFPHDKPVGARISAQDWVDGGWSVEESVILTQELKKRGCAYIHVSSAGLSPVQQITLCPGYQVPFAERIKQAGLPTIAVGLITGAEQAEAILEAKQADLIAVGRGMLYDPRWGWHAAAALKAQVAAPPQYWRSQPHGLKDLFKTT